MKEWIGKNILIVCLSCTIIYCSVLYGLFLWFPKIWQPILINDIILILLPLPTFFLALWRGINHDKQAKISEKSQIIDAHTKALEFLFSTNVSRQIAGVISLEKIALDYQTHYLKDSVDILCTWIREEYSYDSDDKIPLLSRSLSRSIQAVVKLCNQVECEVDLSKSNLREGFFWEAQLCDGLFEKSYIENGTFEDSELTGAKFDGALLKGTTFFGSTLCKASFKNANLTDCDLANTDLQDTSFIGAILTGVSFVDCVISQNTNFNNVTCHYIYLDRKRTIRYPKDTVFDENEFEKFIKDRFSI